MTTLSVPNANFVNGTAADADQVDANNAAIIAWANGNIDATNINQTTSFTWTGTHTYSGANTLKIPTNPPTQNNGVGLNTTSGALQYYSSNLRHIFPSNKQTEKGVNYTFARATTTTTGDTLSIKTVGNAVPSATDPVQFSMQESARGGLQEFVTLTSSTLIPISGAHWGLDTKGNVTDAVLRVYVINDGSASAKIGIGLKGGLTSITAANAFTVPASVTLPEHLLVNSALGGTSPVTEIGYILASFTDATNVWAINTNGLLPGKSGDGVWWTFNPAFTGWVAPTVTYARCCSFGNEGHVKFAVTGTSNATTATFSLPWKAVRAESHTGSTNTDNSVAATTVPLLRTTASSVTVDTFKDITAAAWTNANTKAFQGHIIYEM